ncbi:MAG TPA: adenylyl-sulfate kinase [Alphaproteobacteria bacterium]|nr:adenylyl-sulfate kinase [Alphaproteobacteria bacterium]
MPPEVSAPPCAAPTGKDETSLLQFVTCGNVDDGKSTLVGRLLHDSGCLAEDQVAQIYAESRRKGLGHVDFSLVFDGLEAEREQGITIDVAYRYFATPRRRFTVLDAPGHQQYTARMAAACSNADAAVLVADASRGISEQTRRHAQIVAMMGVRQVVLAVNKMDAVGFSFDAFESVSEAFLRFAGALDLSRVVCIPVSALRGDNVFQRSAAMTWFGGPTLMECLEGLASRAGTGSTALRLPIQLVVRSDAGRRYCGTVVSGSLRAGQSVTAFPSRQTVTVTRLWAGADPLDRVESGHAVSVELAETVDIGRGMVLASGTPAPELSDRATANLLWMDQAPLLPGREYLLRAGTSELHAAVTRIHSKCDPDLKKHTDARHLDMNEIALCSIRLSAPLAFDLYRVCRPTGSFILIDRVTNATAGAGMFVAAEAATGNVFWQALDVDKHARTAIKGHKPCVLWLTGLSGAGKSTIANLVERALSTAGVHTYVLDGDNVRHGLNKDLGFTAEDRVENIRRIAEVAKLFVDAGLIVIVSFISPFRQERRAARALVEDGEFVEIYVSASVETCERRDPKGLYRRARRGEIADFTGVSAPYEPPEAPEIVIDTETMPPETAAMQIIEWLHRHRIIASLPSAAPSAPASS